jgi:hypothetical protein
VRVISEILPEARRDLVQLLEGRASVASDAVLFAAEFLADIEQQFTQFEGFPPGVRQTRGSDGAEWWWRYVNGVWAVYHVRNSRTWLFGETIRTITVVAFEAALPVA